MRGPFVGRWVCLAWMVLLAAPLPAVSVKTWSVSTREGFLSGTLDGTAIDEEGRVRLAPRAETLWGPDEGIVWAVQSIADGGVFAAVSGPGRLLYVSASGVAESWYEAPREALVNALVDDGSGGVFVGVSPEGQVLHARGLDDVAVLTDTDSTFVWSLARGDDGSLWIGTGLPGRVLRWADGELETVFESGDDPVRCMMAIPGGDVVFGTGGRGRVVRLDERRRPFVLLDADETEIVALARISDGTLFALAAKGQGPGRRDSDAMRSAAPAAASDTVVVRAEPDPGGAEPRPDTAPAPRQISSPPPRTAPGGVLYRIDADGGTRAIWETAREMPFALTTTDDDRLLVATGDSGRIFMLDPTGSWSRLLRIPSDQASALAKSPDGSILVGGANDARVVKLGPRPVKSGAYSSPPIDAGTVADWGRVRWDAEVPRGTSVSAAVRSGNTSEPDSTWSGWTPLDGAANDAGHDPDVPAARWFQIRVDMRSGGDRSPTLHRLESFHLPRNRPPSISSFLIELPGVVWLRNPVQGGARRGPTVALDPVARQASEGLMGNRAAVPRRRAYEAGTRSFSWVADDPDGDRLRFSVELQREGAGVWFPVAKQLDETYFSWDARGMPDGSYRARVTAVDAPDNPRGDEMSDRELSVLFRIDNSRPAVTDLRVQREGDRVRLEFIASDPGGGVAAVDVAADADAWTPAHPLDGVADSAEERYSVTVAPSEGSDLVRSLRVRVVDSSGNLGGELWLSDEP